MTEKLLTGTLSLNTTNQPLFYGIGLGRGPRKRISISIDGHIAVITLQFSHWSMFTSNVA